MLLTKRQLHGRALIQDVFMDGTDQNYLVDQHNILRETVKVEPANMHYLRWSIKMEKIARDNVITCRLPPFLNWSLTAV